METDDTIVQQTRNWISSVVIGCNFCPFAAKVFRQNSIHYQLVHPNGMAACLQALTEELERLNRQPGIETTLLIIPEGFADFYHYLDLVEMAEKLLKKLGYEGIYQIASFHPEYLFSGAPASDPANYTNRSLYPMLQVLRESGITKALEGFAHPEKIPQRNIEFAGQKGLAYMQRLRDDCL
jgi:hypothetical protein